MSTFLQQTVNGLSLGSVYLLIGVGLTLVLGVSRVMNFGQGQLVVLGGYVAFALVGAGLAWWAGVVLAAVAVGALAVALYVVFLRRVAADQLATFIVTLGIGIVIEQVIVEIWSPLQRQVAAPLDGTVGALGVTLTEARIVLIIACVPIVAGLSWLLGRTLVGRRMRAAADSPEDVMLLGVNVGRLTVLAFFLGAALAGLAGALLGILFPFTPFSGGAFLVKGFAVALAGGAGNVHGAVVAGLALGLVETYASAYTVPIGVTELGPEWRDGYAFVLLIAILAWRPQGLFRGTGAV